MLDSDTKRRIDNARDILVGKVPDPKAQVEQITIALIYKFMDDMDQQSVNLGGEASFFTGEFAQYAWHRLMSPALGGHERLNLYMQALMRMDENPGLPTLFRNIFKNAYLPYNAPDTLNLFLKEIDGFVYDHSERLGDAFEYLLMVLGSQGDAGQFRTPRHIIEFIVDCVNPTKDDRVLDPACGTAGFLISAYKHILEQHGEENPLTGEEKAELMENFTGYDISPDMVRLALVNLYLHQFPDPNVYEYDTLSSEERWEEYAEVILANPPFMTPKGGIIPHNRFSIQARRSEVLFVDYIAEHLTPDGRAGIIVPEGIIFQSSNAYKKLRKMLIEDTGLYAVVSLPSGVFEPYSGVKTSILFIDRTKRRANDSILFCDVKNTGISLGATNAPIPENDLPDALSDILKFQKGDEPNSAISMVIPITDIEAMEYDLSLNKYKAIEILNTDCEIFQLSEVSSIEKGKSSSTKTKPGEYSLFLTAAEQKTSDHYDFDTDGVAVPLISALGHGKAAIKRIHRVKGQVAIANLLALVEPDKTIVNPDFLFHMLDYKKDAMAGLMTGAANVSMKVADLEHFRIPLPPLAVQEEIVAEIESYQRVIDGARQVVESYQPRIPLDPDWEMVALGEVCEVNRESENPSEKFGNDEFIYIDISSVDNETGIVSFDNNILGTEAPSRARRVIQAGDVLLSTVRPNLKSFALLKTVPDKSLASTGFAVLTPTDRVLSHYLYTQLLSDFMVNQMIARMGKGAYPSINQTDVKQLKFPLPPIETQREIVAQIEAEQALVDANRQLIEIFERKIEEKIAGIWGNDDQS